MSESTDAAGKSGRLIQFGLRPRAVPADDAEYLELIREFLSSVDFQAVTKAFADGLGLRVPGRH